MRMRNGLLAAVLAVVLAAACVWRVGSVSASWAYAFVVYDGNLYAMSGEQVAPDRIGSKIGQVTMYSTEETAAFSGNYSNRYPKGAKFFEIKGVGIREAIAVKESEGVYAKAEFRGERAGGQGDHAVSPSGNGPADGLLRAGWVPYVLFAPILVFAAGYGVVRKIRRAGK